MKRYIYNIQYNQKDKEFDTIYVDANTKTEALEKLKKQFPGVYAKHYVKVEKELP